MSSLKNFHIIKKIGEGNFCKVYLVNRKLDNKEYALKIVSLYL